MGRKILVHQGNAASISVHLIQEWWLAQALVPESSICSEMTKLYSVDGSLGLDGWRSSNGGLI